MTAGRLVLLAAAAITTGSCGVARAGTLRICASDLTDFDDMPVLSLPSGLIFTEWGPESGDLRTLRLDPDYPPARSTGQAAIVTEAAVTLTAPAPCADVEARALVSAGHDWRRPTIPAGKSTFLASDTLGPDGPRALGAEERALYEILTMNVLAARPATTIADAETTP